MKKEKEQTYANKSEELIKTLLNEKSDYYKNLDNEHIAIERTNKEPYYSVCVNYMGTGIHIPVDDIDEQEVCDAGIKVWKTASYKF